MNIDCHAHVVPQSLMDAVRSTAAEYPSVKLSEAGQSFGFSFSGSKPTRPVMKPLTEVPSRIAWMDEQKIDRQACGGWLDMFGYELPIEEGARWSRMINDHISSECKNEQRLIGLATVPLQHGATAAEVLKEAHAQGLKGAMIGTQPKGAGGVLDDPDLDPFWQAAHDLGSAIFIHPVFESGDNRVHDYGMANAVGRVTDTLIAVSRLIYAGHILKYSNAKIIIGIGGAALPFVIGRLRRNYNLDKDNLADPDASLAQLYYDTIVQDPAVLRFLGDKVGVDRIMMGSDYPFPIGDFEPMKVVGEAGFSAAEMASMNGGLAEKIFG